MTYSSSIFTLTKYEFMCPLNRVYHIYQLSNTINILHEYTRSARHSRGLLFLSPLLLSVSGFSYLAAVVWLGCCCAGVLKFALGLSTLQLRCVVVDVRYYRCGLLFRSFSSRWVRSLLRGRWLHCHDIHVVLFVVRIRQFFEAAGKLNTLFILVGRRLRCFSRSLPCMILPISLGIEIWCDQRWSS